MTLSSLSRRHVAYVSGVVLLLAILMNVSAHDKFFDLGDDRSALLASTAHPDAWFAATTPQELESVWSDDDGLSLKKKLQSIERFETTVMVEVKLVGFNGDGYRKFVASEGELQQYLEASGINLNPHPYAIRVNPVDVTESTGATLDIDGSTSGSTAKKERVIFVGEQSSVPGTSGSKTSTRGYKLPFPRYFMFVVSRANEDLSKAVKSAIQKEVDEQAERHEQFRRENDGKVQPNGRPVKLPQPAHKIWFHIRHKAVERVLKRDFESGSLAYTIYILSPSAPSVIVPPPLPISEKKEINNKNRQAQTGRRAAVRYVYSEHSRVQKLKKEDDQLTMLPTCENTIWASKRRFAFIDLTAGPVSYGPQVGGDGIFTELSLPRLDRLFMRHKKEVKKTIKRKEKKLRKRAEADSNNNNNEGEGEEETPVTKLSKKKKDRAKRRDLRAKAHEFLSEVAKVVRVTSQQLMAPPLWHYPVRYAKRIVVNLVIMSDYNQADSPQEMKRWQLMAARLQDVAVADQTVRVDISHVSFDDCELCVTAFTHSLRAHTSTFAAHGGLRSQVHQYLDSASLHDWLEHFERGFWNLRSGSIKQTQQLHADMVRVRREEKEREIRERRDGNDANTGPDADAESAIRAVNVKNVKATSATLVNLAKDEILDDDVRAVTAFIFDLQTEGVLLLDRFHQSVSFPGLVVAVQTRAQLAPVDLACNGRQMLFNPNDVSRSVYASLLQTLWGVTPSGTVYNPISNMTEPDLMWGIGLTPFGHLSQLMDASFSLRDAISRNVVYSDVADVITNIRNIRKHFAKYRRKLEDITTRQEQKALLQRYNLLKFKMLKTQALLGQNQLTEALHYVRSARHDVLAIHDLIHAALDRLVPVITCSREERKALMVATAAPALQYAWAIGEFCVVIVFVILLWSWLYGCDGSSNNTNKHMQDPYHRPSLQVSGLKGGLLANLLGVLGMSHLITTNTHSNTRGRTGYAGIAPELSDDVVLGTQTHKQSLWQRICCCCRRGGGNGGRGYNNNRGGFGVFGGGDKHAMD